MREKTTCTETRMRVNWFEPVHSSCLGESPGPCFHCTYISLLHLVTTCVGGLLQGLGRDAGGAAVIVYQVQQHGHHVLQAPLVPVAVDGQPVPQIPCLLACQRRHLVSGKSFVDPRLFLGISTGCVLFGTPPPPGGFQ